jgi:hypothetical protein
VREKQINTVNHGNKLIKVSERERNLFINAGGILKQQQQSQNTHICIQFLFLLIYLYDIIEMAH